jgi:hypothetical protein
MTLTQGPDPGVLREALVVAVGQCDDLLETVLVEERQVPCEASVLGDAVPGSPGRGVQHHAGGGLGVGHGEHGRDGAADAAAHQVRLLDAEVLEQALSLGGVVGPNP